MASDFENPNPALASSDAAQNLKFEREDWTLFRTIDGLTQKAGTSRKHLARLVLKELADNGLDAGAKVNVGELPKAGSYFVEDDGPGIDGTPEEIARLYSIRRPLVSSKLLRLPTRGAVGNGLRVVAGAVLASGGSLAVITRNRRIDLRPERDGTTSVLSTKTVKHPGTRIEIAFGPDLPCDEDTLRWAMLARDLAGFGSIYSGKTSPWWYDVPAFHELLDAAGNRPVRELVAELDGCSGGKAGEIVAEAGLNRATCAGVNCAQAEKLLTAARGQCRPVNPKRLGTVGPDLYSDLPTASYACAYGTVEFGAAGLAAAIPFVVEAWAAPTKGKTLIIAACVNRTPVVGNIRAARDKRDIDAFGCGLHHNVAKAPAEAQFIIQLNIITPFMPITSDGKEPDFKPFLAKICTAMSKAVRKAHRPNAGSGTSQKDVVLSHLDEVIADVSGNGEFRFNARQLFYGLRPIVMQELDEELKIGNFTAIITDYESEFGEIEGMYREPRGSITHPHRDETITLGTLMVEEYERPEWTFNKLVYIEKEGANEALKETGWLERNDCAVMSSKGFSTRAARDLIDKLVEDDESVEVFCVHDADASGTMIFQTLQEATKARDARKIQIINLGLEPWEALEMGLEVENVEEGKRSKAVADYAINGSEGDWEEWLQTHRVELNAMTTPQFIRWLDQKMATHGVGKLIPPGDVLVEELDERIEKKVRETLTERILREAGLEKQVKAAIKAIKTPSAAALTKGIKASFRQKSDREWRAHIEDEAKKRTLKV